MKKRLKRITRGEVDGVRQEARMGEKAQATWYEERGRFGEQVEKGPNIAKFGRARVRKKRSAGRRRAGCDGCDGAMEQWNGAAEAWANEARFAKA